MDEEGGSETGQKGMKGKRKQVNGGETRMMLMIIIKNLSIEYACQAKFEYNANGNK